MAVLQQIRLPETIGGMLLMCQNTTMQVNGAWIKRCCVLCSKPYNSYIAQIRDKPLGLPAFVKLVYCGVTASARSGQTDRQTDGRMEGNYFIVLLNFPQKGKGQ